MNDITINGNGQSYVPGMTDLGEMGATVNDLSNQVGSILGDALKIVNTGTPNALKIGDGKTNGPTDIDAPKGGLLTEENLETVVAFLKLAVDEKQVKLLLQRIESHKAEIDTQADNRMKEVEKNLKDMDKAAEAAKWRKALGWLGAAIVAVIAIVTVATGGAAGFAIASAVFALGMQGLQEGKVFEKITDAIAEKLREDNPDMSRAKANFIASMIMMGCMIVVSAATMGICAKYLASDFGAQMATMASQLVLGIANAGAGIATAIYAKQSGETQENLKELEKIIKALQQNLDKSQDDLENVIKMLQDGMQELIDFVDSKANSQMQISENMLKMV